MIVPPFARMDRDIPVPQPSIEEKGRGGEATGFTSIAALFSIIVKLRTIII